MKRKFLAKAITLGLMLAVPFGAQAAITPVVDENNNLTYKVSEGFIGTLERLSLTNDTNGNTIYNGSKVNDLSIIKSENNKDILVSLWNNALRMNIDGTFTIQDTAHDNIDWQPTVHLDTNQSNIDIFDVKAKNIIVQGGSQIGFNIYSRNDDTKAEVNLEAQDSVKITAGGAAINLSDQKTNIINVAAGNNITIESDNNAMSIGKEANATLTAGGQINLKSNGSRSVLNNSGNVSVNSKIVNINSNSIAIDNTGTLNINQNYKGNINETTLNIYNVLNNNTDAGIIKASAGVISVISNCEGTVNTIISNYGNASLDLRATNGDIRVTSRKDQDSYYNSNYGIQANGNVNLNAENGKVIIDVYQRGLNAGTGGNVDIKAKEVDITSGTHVINAYGGSTVTIEAEKIYLNAKNGIDPIYGNYDLGINVSSGSKVEFKNAKEVSVIGGISAKGTDNTGKVSSVDINASNNIYIEGTIKNVAEGTASILGTAGNINIGSDNQDTIIKIDGNIYSGEFPGAIENIEGGDGVAKADGGSINISLNNENSSLNGNIYDNDQATGAENGVHLEVNNGATWTTNGDSTVKEVKSNGGVIDLAGTDQKVDIKKITSDDTNKGTTIKTDSIDNKLTIGSNNSKLDVVASGKVTDSIGNDIQGGMKKLLENIEVKDGTKETTVKAEAGAVTGETTISRDEDGNTSAAVEKVHKENAGISEMASIGLMAWRAENNDMNKRLGELRSSKGEHGVWTRMVRGQSKYGAQGIKNQYSTYQLGYDEKLSVDKHWTVGAAVSYTDASSSFTTGHGENKSTGLAIYGSYLGDNGSFVDLIAKAARLKNEFDVMGGAGKGDYETNGYSLSAEYGKRFTKDNGFWIEPQVELTYGYVGAVDYLTSNDVSVRQNGMDSLVGRIGFSLGRDIKAGNVYARASYLYDFDGETDVAFSKKGVTRPFKQDLGGGWWEVGVGTNLSLSDATHLYFDVEKTYSGNVVTPWQWNAGVRWSF